jgi:hypothetical protein
VSARSESPTERRWLFLLLVVYGAALALLLAHHEMWRDELQGWLLARDSGNLGQLWHNTRYEGHPLLWHLILFPLAHLTASPVAMQVVHWGVAVGVAALVLFAAPFQVWVRALIVFGYFPLYEYGAISRNYGLTVLGLWLACAVLARHGPPLAAAGGAALAANASPMGIVLAPAVAAAAWASAAPGRARSLAVGVIVVAAGVGALQCLPPADYEHAREWFFRWEPLRAAYVARGFAAALLPLPRAELHFWNTSALFPPVTPGQSLSPGVGVGGVVLVAAFLAVAFGVRRSRAALSAWLLGVAALLGFAYVKFPGTTRHWGFVWVLLVGVVWLGVGGGEVRSRRGTLLLAPAIVAGVAGSLVAGWWEWRAPFSGAKCAASQLRLQGLGTLPLVGGVDWASSGVAAYLPGGRLYYPASRAEGSFIVWNMTRTRQESLSISSIVGEARGRDRGNGIVLLLNEQLPAGDVTGCRAAFECGPTIVPDESIYGYVCYGSR